ncbi:hypothetical protein RHECNPAF_430033 [Rhizobium etli CNPAF512]|nr:hypothetical protein RHECNPAF_430033 [Rhizobium etli CNPAF512]
MISAGFSDCSGIEARHRRSSSGRSLVQIRMLTLRF